jgi:hypothetical protein
MEVSLRSLRPFVGARIIKTGLSVFLTLLIFHLIDPSLAAFAAVAAILAVQPSVSQAKTVLFQQTLANLVGGCIAAIIGLWIGTTPLAMALGVVVVLGILHRFGLNEAAGLSVVVVLFVMDRPHQDFLLYTAARTGALIGGMLIGSMVNRFVRPPRITARLHEEFQAVGASADTFLSHLISSLGQPDRYGKDEIKGEAGAIEKRLETARSLLEASREAPDVRRHLPVLEESLGSLFVFSESIMDIHKLVLHAGGLERGPIREAVAQALNSVKEYRREVMTAAREGRTPVPGPAAAFRAALTNLHELVDGLVENRDSRPLGMTLHSVADHILHMGGRMERLAWLLPLAKEAPKA